MTCADDEETVQERTFFHEDDAFHDRTDWFLVGHGILFEAFFSARDKGLSLPVWLFGLVSAWIWLAVSLRQLPQLNSMKRDFEYVAKSYRKEQRRRRLHDKRRPRYLFPFFLHATTWFGVALPVACLGAWLWMGADTYRFPPHCPKMDPERWVALTVFLLFFLVSCCVRNRQIKGARKQPSGGRPTRP
jgi:uncharacterized protein (DUF983 family)